jgi:DNA repair protein RadC
VTQLNTTVLLHEVEPMAVLMADVPPELRPRERLFAHGPDPLHERDMVSLVLRNGTRGASALDVADQLLSHYGDLPRLGAARAVELAERPGMGAAKAAGLVAAFWLGRRSMVGSEPAVLLGPADVHRAVAPLLAAEKRERLLLLVCDTRHRVCHIETITTGSADQTLFPLPEILGCALRNHGAAIALAHNHPGGDPTPSDADREATIALAAAAEMVRLQFLFHVVVCADDWEEVPLSRRAVSAPW